MDKNYQPRLVRHTITGSLARRIIKQMIFEGGYDKGELVLNGDFEDYNIGHYEIEVRQNNNYLNYNDFYIFVGKTVSGRILSHEECAEIMELQTIKCTYLGEKFGQLDWWELKEKPHNELDDLISPQKFIEKAITENSNAQKEEIERIKQYTNYKKSELHKNFILCLHLIFL